MCCCSCLQGTLARDILGNPAEVMTRNGVKVGLRSPFF